MAQVAWRADAPIPFEARSARLAEKDRASANRKRPEDLPVEPEATPVADLSWGRVG